MADSTVTTIAGLPDWAQPYYQQMMASSQTAAQRQFQPYTQPLTQGLSANQNSAIAMQNDLATRLPAGMQKAQDMVGSAYNNASNAGNMTLGQINGGYQAGAMGNAGAFDPSQIGTGQWSNAAAQQYMNPFTQQVINNTTGLMNTNFQKQNLDMATQQKQAGAFGGYRSDLQNSEAQKNQNLALGNTIGGLNMQGYQNAQQMYTADQARDLQAQAAQEQSKQFGANQGLSRYQAQQAALQQQGAQTIQSQQANTANQLAQGNLQLQGATASGNLGVGLGNLAAQQRNMEQNAIQGLQTTGALEQQTGQNALNSAYGQYLAAQNWPMQQQTALSGILHGVPMPTSSIQTGVAAPPNIYSQLAGAGIAGIGLANSLNPTPTAPKP